MKTIKFTLKERWQLWKLKYAALKQFIQVLQQPDKAGVLVIYDAVERKIDVYRHNVELEGARDLTLLGLSALNQQLLKRAALRAFSRRNVIHTN